MEKEVKKRFCIAVASFGNSEKGGFLYVGVNDAGNIVGLEKDKDHGGFLDYEDVFANSMRETLFNFFQDKIFIISKLEIKFFKRDEKIICIIQIKPSDNPVWVHGKKTEDPEFYVRGSSPRTERLNFKESIIFINKRFPNFVD